MRESQRDDRVALYDMIRFGQRIAETLERYQKDGIEDDSDAALILQRLVHIFGEAATRVSAPLREQNPQIPWQKIISMRNHLAHGYDDIAHDVVLSVALLHIPALLEHLQALLNQKSE
jgi:uncharacterized protein with HEPN domain